MSIKNLSIFIVSALVSNCIFAQSLSSESVIYKCINNGTEVISNRKINKSCQPIIYKKIKKNTAANNTHTKNKNTAANHNNNSSNNSNNKNTEVASVVRTKSKNNITNNYNNFYNYNNSNNSVYSYENNFTNHNKTEYPKISPQTQKNRFWIMVSLLKLTIKRSKLLDENVLLMIQLLLHKVCFLLNYLGEFDLLI